MTDFPTKLPEQDLQNVMVGLGILLKYAKRTELRMEAAHNYISVHASPPLCPAFFPFKPDDAIELDVNDQEMLGYFGWAFDDSNDNGAADNWDWYYGVVPT